MLTDTQIKNARDAGKLTDAKGLYIEVRPTGAKFWRYRYKLKDRNTGRPVEYLYAIGEYCKAPDLEAPAQTAQRMAAGQYTLEEARIERLRLRGLVKQGRHPIDERNERAALNRTQQANTFETVAREWLARRSRKWKGKTAKLVTAMLELDVFPKIGSKAIRQVTPADLLAIIEAVEARAPSVAFALRQHCGAVFRFGMSKLLVDGDPTTALRGAIDKPAVKHHSPLPSTEIPKLRKKLESSNSMTAIGLNLLLLTFVRPTELRASTWPEFDLDGALWKIPAERMKGKREHFVPLSNQAVALLRKLHKITGSGTHLFPHIRKPDGCMGENTLRTSLIRMGYEGTFTVHGFRATASTYLNETNYRPDVIEVQLAHKEKNATRGSYNRAQYLPERKQMMQGYADHIDALCAGANVTPIRKGKAA